MPKFREVSGQFVGYIPDSIDSDIVPDRAPMSGRVTFTPVFTGGVIAFPELMPPEFAHPRTIHARIVDGFVQVEVNEGEGDDEQIVLQPLTLMVTVDDEASQVWSWRAEFDEILIGASDEYVKIPSWSFRVPDGTGPVDLTELVPLKSTGTVDVTKGPRGAGLQTITAQNGELVFEYTDGEETVIPMPEAVQGPPGADGAPGPQGETGEQGPEGPQGPAPDLLVGNITDATPTGKNLMLAATEGAARNALGLQAGATATAGSLAELASGTSTATRVWSPSNLAEYINAHTEETRESFSVLEFGADPTGTNSSTEAINATLAAANSAGKKATIPSGTYRLGTSLDFPAGSRIHADEATLVGETDYEFLRMDAGEISITGHLIVVRRSASAFPRAVRIGGANVSIQELSVQGHEPGVGASSGNENAVGFSAASNVSVGRLNVKNYEHAVRIQNCSGVTIQGGDIDTYRRGIYIQSSRNVSISNVNVFGESPSATVAAGHNAILAESTNGHNSTSDIRITDVSIKDSGEHGIRFGGQQKISNVWVTNVQISKTGACGIKILGGTQASNNYHENIFMRGILVRDIGTLNAAMAGIMVQFVKNATISDFQVVPVENSISCGAGIEMQAVDGVQIINPIIREASTAGVRIDFVLGNVSNVLVSGGLITSAAGVGLSLDYTNRAFYNVRFKGVQVEATSSTARCVKVRMANGTPTVSSCSIGILTSADSSRIFDTGAETLYTEWKGEVEGQFSNVPLRNGSTWSDWQSGTVRTRKSGAWVEA